MQFRQKRAANRIVDSIGCCCCCCCCCCCRWLPSPYSFEKEMTNGKANDGGGNSVTWPVPTSPIGRLTVNQKEKKDHIKNRIDMGMLFFLSFLMICCFFFGFSSRSANVGRFGSLFFFLLKRFIVFPIRFFANSSASLSLSLSFFFCPFFFLFFVLFNGAKWAPTGSKGRVD